MGAANLLADNFPDDYKPWATFAEEHASVVGTKRSFQWELTTNRDAFRNAGVILEITKGGSGERSRVLVSPSRYFAFWRAKTRQR